jgi:hypothetical protein
MVLRLAYLNDVSNVLLVDNAKKIQIREVVLKIISVRIDHLRRCSCLIRRQRKHYLHQSWCHLR